MQPQQLTVSTGSSQQIISVMPQSKGRQISTIDQWTAFLVFGAVYTQRFPEVAHGMFKYCEVVRDIAQTGPPFAWRQYDEQFRSFRQSNPMNFPWDQHRLDLFFRCMYTRQVQMGMGRAPATIPNKPTRPSQPFPAGYCWMYQRNNKCTSRPRRYKHVCSKCQAPHPASSCCQRNAPNPNKP